MRPSRLTLLATLAVAIGLLAASPASTKALDAPEPADEVVLPSRVSTAINRAEISLDTAIGAVDGGDTAKAVASLQALRQNLFRADRAARQQMNAAPPAEEDADVEVTTTGPDSVIAVLTLDQTVATTLAGLFDKKQGTILSGFSSGLFAALNTRDKLLTAVIALDPEGAGVDYADGMADTVAGYDDEVANLSEALATDQLSVGGKKVLTAALNQSKATQAKVAAAFGGGE